MHGTIGNTPCDRLWWTEDENNLYIHAEIGDRRIFARKLHLSRVIAVSKNDSRFTVTDTVENQGDTESPIMLLYHMNMGYPLLSERSVVDISSTEVKPRNEHAAKDLDTWANMLPPTPGFEEQCYYHSFDREGHASIYNPDVRKGLTIKFDTAQLDHFTQWKMMGVHDYVLGLEPGNCTPDGRDVIRRQGKLKYLESGESKTYQVSITLFEQ